MSRDLGGDSDVDTEPPESTANDDPYANDETGEPGVVDRSGAIEGSAEREAEFSWTSSAVYFPLIIGGLALVAFPGPVTSLVGLVSIAIGICLAAVDLLSPAGGVA